jgi:hypothetical protein
VGLVHGILEQPVAELPAPELLQRMVAHVEVIDTGCQAVHVHRHDVHIARVARATRRAGLA